MPPVDDTIGDPLDARSLGIIEEFERAWESARPDVGPHWERHPERPPRLLMELAAIDLGNRLERGEQATVEEYEERFPALVADPALSRELRRVAGRFAGRRAFDATGSPDAAGGDVEFAPSLFPDDPSSGDPLVGTDVGGVLIVRVIADGGMGRVYEGRQDRPRRPVAVKVIKPGLTSPALLKRFEYEAQVLGRLRHPGIAQIHTVGTHVVGGQTVPYFVMEYIPNAKSLTQYAEALKLSTHERLELFRKVCEAVAHGHQKGVIHRDLKPGNVLVDSAGQPKVIDFGVARSTDSDMALTTMQTDVGALIGTLQYMSPEQFDADPNDLDVRLDVYALGVILYELLTGKPPYDVKQRAILEIARVVREEEPTPISSLDKTLRRDVAIIAGKCLQKDRNRRYSSATELAGDVSRYLAGEPITAAPPTFRDAVARLARRHKAAALAVAGIAASLMAAVVGISAFAIRAERAREEATRQTAVAIHERAAADRERDAATQARAVADAEATKARRQLYAATVYKLQTALESPTRGLAKEVFQDAEKAYRDAYGKNGGQPLELSLLKPQLDGAIAVLSGRDAAGESIAGESIDCLAFSPDGSRLVTGGFATAWIWNATTGRLLATLKGHEQSITALVFSPDGSRLATASWDNTVRIWDVQTGKSLAVVKATKNWRQCLAFSGDGSRLAAVTEADSVQVWDIAARACLHDLQVHDTPVNVVALSSDGTRLATGTEEDGGVIVNTTTGEVLATLEQPAITRLAFSPDCGRLAIGSRDGTLGLWDVARGESLPVRQRHQADIWALTFNREGSHIASGSADHTVRLWDATTGECLTTFQGHQSNLTAVAFSPDGSRLATASVDGSARLWNTSTGESLAVLKGRGSAMTCLAFSPDGSRLATGDGPVHGRPLPGQPGSTARLWDASTSESMAVLAGNGAGVWSLVFSPDGRQLVTGSGDGAIKLWDAETAEFLSVLGGHQGLVTSLSIGADGAILASGSLDGMAGTWDVATGSPLTRFGGPGEANLCALSPDGSRAATASTDGDGVVRLWNAASGTSIAVLRGHTGGVHAVAFSPDGSRLATGGRDNTCRLWDAASGESLAVLAGHESWIQYLAFSPDGSRLATASDDATARIWQVATGECLGVLRGHASNLTAVAFNATGSLLATGSDDTTARLWDGATGRSVAILKGHDDTITCLAFSPDGSRLATGAADATTRLWNTITGESVSVLRGHERLVRKVGFSPDGSRLATGSDDGTVRIWGLSNAEIYRNRLAAAAARTRVAPVVDDWLDGDQAAVKAKLAAAKATMTPEDWRAAANLVLRRAAGE